MPGARWAVFATQSVFGCLGSGDNRDAGALTESTQFQQQLAVCTYVNLLNDIELRFGNSIFEKNDPLLRIALSGSPYQAVEVGSGLMDCLRP
jgi:hypothetical protein